MNRCHHVAWGGRGFLNMLRTLKYPEWDIPMRLYKVGFAPRTTMVILGGTLHAFCYAKLHCRVEITLQCVRGNNLPVFSESGDEHAQSAYNVNIITLYVVENFCELAFLAK